MEKSKSRIKGIQFKNKRNILLTISFMRKAKRIFLNLFGGEEAQKFSLMEISKKLPRSCQVKEFKNKFQRNPENKS